MFIFFSYCGIQLIYRASLKESEFIRINGNLLRKEIREVGNIRPNRKANYAIVISLEKQVKQYGIYAGTLKQAQLKEKRLALSTGKKYTFFIDPTVVSTKNVTVGIRVIKQGNKIIYKEQTTSHSVFGILFIALGLVTWILFNFLAKKKFG